MLLLVREQTKPACSSMKVLFVCEGNTCRSVFAEHLARKLYPEPWCSFESAGIEPGNAGNEPRTLKVLSAYHHIDASKHQQRLYSSDDLRSSDVIVIAMDRRVQAFLKRKLHEIHPESSKKIHLWHFVDPYASHKDDIQKHMERAEEIWERLKATDPRSLT